MFIKPELLDSIKHAIIFYTIPGGMGGLVCFLLALQKGHYRNNKYIAKFFIEILGAMVTASFITYLIAKDENYQAAFAFVIGFAWSNIMQMIRSKVTNITENVIREYLKGEKKCG